MSKSNTPSDRIEKISYNKRSHYKDILYDVSGFRSNKIAAYIITKCKGLFNRNCFTPGKHMALI